MIEKWTPLIKRYPIEWTSATHNGAGTRLKENFKHQLTRKYKSTASQNSDLPNGYIQFDYEERGYIASQKLDQSNDYIWLGHHD